MGSVDRGRAGPGRGVTPGVTPGVTRPGGAAAEEERVRTGSSELDAILEGGFPAHSINIIMGGPGTGKTVLAQQLLFHNASPDRRGVYLTTLSEPLSKVVRYLQRFDFYDESRFFDAITYDDIGAELLEHGIEYLLTRVKKVIQELKPDVLVIDSFKALHDIAESPLAMRRLAAELGGLLSAYRVTTFLVGEYGPEAAAEYPEFAVADGIVELTRLESAKRDERHLRVRKLRGSGYLQGMHAFSLGQAGFDAYPRLITPRDPVQYAAQMERVQSGLDPLDAMLEGGLWRGSTTLVVGPAGSGKTTLALGFALQGVEKGEPSLYLNFQENPTQLVRTIHGLGIDLPGARERGLHLLYRSPVELTIDSVIVELFTAVEEHGVRRVAVDTLGELALAAGTVERFHDYVYSMIQHLAVRGVTTMLTLEGHVGLQAPHRSDARFSNLADALIEVSIDLQATPPVRRLQVLKARGIHHPLTAVPMQIGEGGITLEPEADDPRG